MFLNHHFDEADEPSCFGPALESIDLAFRPLLFDSIYNAALSEKDMRELVGNAIVVPVIGALQLFVWACTETAV